MTLVDVLVHFEEAALAIEMGIERPSQGWEPVAGDEGNGPVNFRNDAYRLICLSRVTGLHAVAITSGNAGAVPGYTGQRINQSMAAETLPSRSLDPD
jgi:hypothetical protein